MKNLLFFLLIAFVQPLICQTKPDAQSKPSSIEETEENGEIPKENFERPFNFFAAAGASYRFGDLYNVVVSPVDYTVQFEDVFPIHTRFSMGLVWNPFPDNSEVNQKEYSQKVLQFQSGTLAARSVEAARRHAAVALLINIAQLSFSSGEVNTTSPIDVGFGIGYRNDKFLILGTLEFTPMRTPRKYFADDFLDKDKTLILAGAQEPVRTISVEDDTLFTNKVFVSIGVKIAYAFTKSKE
jgi:hypothetical protein